MPGFRDVLERFRPAGTPGAASPVGVPADRRDAVATELEPVFAALSEVVRECDVVRRDAHEAATHLAADSGEQARALVAEARRNAPTERAGAAARRRDDAADELARIGREAETAAEEVYERARTRLPVLVERVAAAVRADFAATDGDLP
jgi:hypothetical protein